MNDTRASITEPFATCCPPLGSLHHIASSTQEASAVFVGQHGAMSLIWPLEKGRIPADTVGHDTAAMHPYSRRTLVQPVSNENTDISKIQDKVDDLENRSSPPAGSQYHVSIRQLYEGQNRLWLQSSMAVIPTSGGADGTWDDSWEDLLNQSKSPRSKWNVVVTADTLSKISDITPVLVYVAGYAIHAALKRLNCLKCRVLLTIYKPINVTIAQKDYELVFSACVLFTAADHLHCADHGPCPQEFASACAPCFPALESEDCAFRPDPDIWMVPPLSHVYVSYRATFGRTMTSMDSDVGTRPPLIKGTSPASSFSGHGNSAVTMSTDIPLFVQVKKRARSKQIINRLFVAEPATVAAMKISTAIVACLVSVLAFSMTEICEARLVPNYASRYIKGGFQVGHDAVPVADVQLPSNPETTPVSAIKPQYSTVLHKNAQLEQNAPADSARANHSRSVDAAVIQVKDDRGCVAMMVCSMGQFGVDGRKVVDFFDELKPSALSPKAPYNQASSVGRSGDSCWSWYSDCQVDPKNLTYVF
ncbi:hypothetical protein HPB49_006239 [Dermacentor silvarum]|uniref:Uncharacterized protein n=1 Tax=Dermacentor silvarum TaxID=543639 RepID=A0ACB8CQ91_DERSI|nr:hypothetical protein HPB49_006239 [Dermacentor silvarum]